MCTWYILWGLEIRSIPTCFVMFVCPNRGAIDFYDERRTKQ